MASTRSVADLSTGISLSVASDVSQVLKGIQTTEGRLAVTVAILLVALALVVFVPRLIAWFTASTTESAEDSEDGEDGQPAGVVREGVRILLARGLQLGILVVSAVALLVIWGRLDEARSLLGDESTVNIIGNGVITLVVGLVAYVAVDVLNEAVARFSEEADRVSDHQEEVVRRIGQFSIMALAIATVLAVWVDDLSGLLVGAGFLGIVVGMAARQTLGSLIAGFVLMFSRPFTIGDWVAIGDEEGIVTEITIVNTRLENFDGEFVVIPNDMVGNRPITNRSRKGHLRLRQEVGIDYDSDPDHAREVALDALAEVDAIEPSPPPQAILTTFGDSAVIIELRFWIDRPTPPRKWRATNAVVEAVHAAFDQEGIKIPYPQRELAGREETGGFRVASPPAARRPAEDGRNGADDPRHQSTGDGHDGQQPAESDDGASETDAND